MQLASPVRDRQRSTTFDQTSSAIGSLASSMVAAVEDFVQEISPPQNRQRGRGGWQRRRARNDCDRCGCQPCTCDPCECGRRDCSQCGGEPCERCEPTACDCLCCVGDVDLVVYTRLGETRVVPIEIHNPRRRERDIDIELGDFTTRGGKPAGVTAAVIGGGKLTLGPCATHELIIVTRVGLVDAGGNDLHKMDRDQSGRIPDVDDCLVAIADMKISGCDMRPLRIALAILPRRCSAHEVSCQHGCC
jgi:hypothetical protein